jgi:hypothetical protein
MQKPSYVSPKRKSSYYNSKSKSKTVRKEGHKEEYKEEHKAGQKEMHMERQKEVYKEEHMERQKEVHKEGHKEIHKEGYNVGYKEKHKEGHNVWYKDDPSSEENQISSPTYMRGCKSPSNTSRAGLLSHRDKLENYREFKKQVSTKGNKTYRDRFSEAGKIKCTHCKYSITAKEYHKHIKQ